MSDLPNDPSRVLGNDLARDISANAQLLLLEDKSWWPGIAVGLEDIGGGASFFRSGYVTLSKTLFGRLRGTVGVGTGPDVLKGPFAGAELALNRFVTLLGQELRSRSDPLQSWQCELSALEDEAPLELPPGALLVETFAFHNEIRHEA